MRILFVSSEVASLVKTGGLADVSAALPAALRKLEMDVRILLPGYPQVMKLLKPLKPAADLRKILKAWPAAKLLAGTMQNGVPVYVLDCPEMYQRGGGLYADEHGQDWPDNPERFALLARVASLLCDGNSPLDWRPELIHCNYWQTGLTPAYLRKEGHQVPVVMTIHNLAYQGNFPKALVPALELSWDDFTLEGYEFYDQLSFLKAGLSFADQITTVSPTYAREIQTEAQGYGMQGLLAHRSSALSGILNGIDLEEWNPAADDNLAACYDDSDMSGKLENKRELQKRLGLHADDDIPLFGLVGRFAHQKGVDVVLDVAERLVNLPAQLVLMGTGDKALQNRALALAHQYPERIAAFVGFDESLSHLVEAGSDMFLMPSRFEPCGLNQMYSQRYGTPPIVHATGGLIDTVVDCNAATLADDSASGFVFYGLSPESLLQAATRAVELYADKAAWRKLQANCMAKDYSWLASAQSYLALYRKLVK